MNFEELQAQCPWRGWEYNDCRANYNKDTSFYGFCRKEDCAIWLMKTLSDEKKDTE